MDWIFDHLQLLIAIGAGLAYWLNQRREAKELEEQQQSEDAFAPEDYEVDADEARARKVREEIRRKIAERRGESSGPVVLSEPMEQPPPLFENPFEEPPRQPAPDPYAREGRREEVAASPSADRAVLDRQRQLEDRMKELEKTRAEAKRRVENLTNKRPSRRRHSAPVGNQSLKDDLRRTGSLRRAIVLREVLGPPVGMK